MTYGRILWFDGLRRQAAQFSCIGYYNATHACELASSGENGPRGGDARNWDNEPRCSE